MLCTTDIIVFFLANSFYSVVWSGIVPRPVGSGTLPHYRTFLRRRQ